MRLLLVPTLALLAMAVSAQQVPAGVSLVTATGAAEAKAEPDMATIRIGVETQGKTAKEAQAGASALANRLVAAAMKIVPDKKAYQTSDLSLYPEYSQNDGGLVPPKLVGYRARNVLTLRLDDVTRVGLLVDAVTEAGATNVDSIAFGLKDDKPARRQALVDAVREARAKAEAMAEGLGLKIAAVYSIDEGAGLVVRPYEMPMAMMGRAKMDTPVMPGEVSLSASVTVRFYLTK